MEVYIKLFPGFKATVFYCLKTLAKYIVNRSPECIEISKFRADVS